MEKIEFFVYTINDLHLNTHTHPHIPDLHNRDRSLENQGFLRQNV